MIVGQPVIIFNKKARGYIASVELGTVKSVTESSFELFDGRVFLAVENALTHSIGYENRDRKYKSTARAPFAWETFASYLDMSDQC